MTNIGVIGGSGYAGGELLRLLLGRSDVSLSLVTSRSRKGDYIFKIHPNLRGFTNIKFEDVSLDRISDRCDLVFTAVPHGAAASIVPELLEAGVRVVDLSADFRLKDPKAYSTWYGREHPCPDLLMKSIYGLPEIHGEEITKASLVANPGCMPTASILALAPLIKANLVERERIVIDVKIGSSGAGIGVSIHSHHAERSNVIRPYDVVSHRHIPEIQQELSLLGGEEVTVSMTPHAVNVVRGILATVHAFSKREITLQDMWRAYRGMYGNKPFVRFAMDRTSMEKFPDPKFVLGSNHCDLGFYIDQRTQRVVVFSAIDNLLKGAAGQAMQNMNIMLGFPEDSGLKAIPIHPI